MDYGTIGLAASDAATAMVFMAAPTTACDLLSADDGQGFDNLTTQAADFVAKAGAVSGEVLFRWSSARELHLLAGQDWASLSAPLRRWFDVFARVADCLAERPQAGGQVFAAPREAAGRFERTHEPEDARDARIDGLRSPTAAPFSVGQAGPVAVAVAAGPAREAFSVSPDMAHVRGEAPTMAQFQAMSPEERRGFAHLFGLQRSASDEEAAMRAGASLTEPAPAVQGEARKTHVDELVDGERIAGDVAVVQPAPKDDGTLKAAGQAAAGKLRARK